METQKFIENAIKGGWNPKPMYYSPRTVSDRGVMWSGDDSDTEFYSIREIVLIPEAWKAVGKTSGWDEQVLNRHYATYGTQTLWLHNWHRMIDALAEGKSVSEFLETL